MTQAPVDEADPLSDAESAAVVSGLERQADRVETPCAEGSVVWRIWGRGRPIVLGHGSQGTWTHWIRNIEALAREYRVIAPDFPGHGDSGMPETRDHAGLTQALVAGLGRILAPGESADFVGFSFGGVQFSHLAARHPDFVRRLVLIGVGGLDTPLGDIDLTGVSGLRGEARKAAHRHNLLGLMLHRPESADALALHLAEANLRKTRFRHPDYQVMPDWVLRSLPDVGAQVDALWGEADRAHPDPDLQAAALRAFKPDLEMRAIPDAGHWAMYENPEAFDAALLDMLRQPLRAR